MQSQFNPKANLDLGNFYNAFDYLLETGCSQERANATSDLWKTPFGVMNPVRYLRFFLQRNMR